MADKEQPSTSSNEQNASSKQIIEGFNDINAYTQQATRAVLQCIRSSHQIPSQGDDYDYYSSFESFRHLMDVEGSRVCDIMQGLLKHYGIKGNLSSTSQAVDTEEKFDVLIDANDQILERAGIFLDEASGVRKTEAALVVASMTPKQPLSGSWNAKPQGGSNKKSQKGRNIRLLTAKNIQRPQLKFADKIDNSHKPFMPRINNKPNAQKPLLESLSFDCDPNDVNDDFVYPHPYQYELDHISYTAHQQENVDEPKMPPSIDASPAAIFVDTVYAMEKMIKSLKQEQEVAIDVEHHSYRSFQGITCLIQISSRTEDYLVDALVLRSELHALNEITTDPNIVKVLHGADMDIQWLQRDLSVYVVNMFDTGQAARLLNLARFGLSHLLMQYCQVEADKQYQLADWRIRPLPEELLKYAREDTHFLLYIYDQLKNRLLNSSNEQKNLLLSVLEKSKHLCGQRYEKPKLNEDSHKRLYIKTRKVFNSQQLYALKHLYAWRDRIGRAEDESTGYILPNHMLLQISELLPKDPQGIVACCNPLPPMVRQNLNEIHGIVKDARQQSLTKPEPPKPKSQPTMYQHPKFDAKSTLNCPHDLKPSAPSSSQAKGIPDPSLVANSSAMFTDSPSIVTVKSAPSITLFDNTKNPSSHLSQAEAKARAIKTAIKSPFEKFLPNSIPCRLPTSLNAEMDPKWKLLPPTEKPKPKTKKVKVILAQPKTDDITVDSKADEEDGGTISLRQELPKTKKRKQHEKKIVTDVADALSELRKQHEASPHKKKLKKEEKEEEADEEEEDTEEKKDEFKPHVYSKEALSMFKGLKKQNQKNKNKRKKKDFNPDEEGLNEDIKGARNQRPNKGGNKSHSFADSKQTFPKMNWPKR